jgi:hypothetical protein
LSEEMDFFNWVARQSVFETGAVDRRIALGLLDRLAPAKK